jgi:protein-disulfide isomerase
MFRGFSLHRILPRSRAARIVLAIIVLMIGVPVTVLTIMVTSYYIRLKNGSAVSPRQELLKQSMARRTVNDTVTPEDLAKLVPKEGMFPTLGSDGAPVTVVAFVDYGCPYTKDSMPAIRKVMENIGNRARLIVRDFPIPELHPEARDAAHASRCVLEQGQKAYWRYQEILFEQQDGMTLEVLRRLVSTANLNVARYDDCMASRKYDLAIDQDVALAERVGVAGTPTFFVNGTRFDGSVDEELFTKLINHFLP